MASTEFIEQLRTELPRLLREHPEVRQYTDDIRSIKADLRMMIVGLSSLGACVGQGLEGVIRGIVEEFAKEDFPFAEQLVLQDDTGEVYGVAGAQVEFDAYVHNGKAAYLVEAKSYLKPGDVWMFQRKVKFAESKLGRPITPLLLALSFAPGALRTLRSLGIPYRVGVVASEELLGGVSRE